MVEARRTISGGTAMPADRHRVAEVELADLRLDLHVDQAAAQHGRREGQADAVALVVDRDRAERAGHRDRILAAGEEARGVARQRHQVRLRQRAGEALLLERIDDDVGLEAAGDQLADDDAERRGARQHAGHDDRRDAERRADVLAADR